VFPATPKECCHSSHQLKAAGNMCRWVVSEISTGYINCSDGAAKPSPQLTNNQPHPSLTCRSLRRTQQEHSQHDYLLVGAGPSKHTMQSTQCMSDGTALCCVSPTTDMMDTAWQHQPRPTAAQYTPYQQYAIAQDTGCPAACNSSGCCDLLG
jgi:hypothetical protein